jgi:hypothetical protein
MLQLVLAFVLVIVAATPAHAVWDFTWVTSAFFPERPPDVLEVRRELAGTSPATITPEGDGIRIAFGTPVGPTSVVVEEGLPAFGEAPVFPGPTGDLTLLAFGLHYDWTGPFSDPDTFTLETFAGASGPGGIVQFSGVGTRQVVPATEPAALLLVAVGLGALARRRAGSASAGRP